MDVKSYRSSLGRVRGLGSARHGTEDWWLLRLTSLALIPLSLYFFLTFFAYVVLNNSYESAVQWLHSPINAAVVILLLGTGFHHGTSGMQVVIEDYIHHDRLKFAALIILKFAAAVLALTGILSVLKILLGA